jgi:hypothetical protein
MDRRELMFMECVCCGGEEAESGADITYVLEVTGHVVSVVFFGEGMLHCRQRFGKVKCGYFVHRLRVNEGGGSLWYLLLVTDGRKM